MGWQEHLLRLMARGELAPGDCERLDTDVALRVLDRIEAQPALATRLDSLDERGVRAEFLALYKEESEGSGET